MSCSAGVRPHVGHRPGGERAHLAQDLAVRQRERFDLAEVRPARRLIAAQRREPDVVVRKRAEERLHLVARAARLGVLLPQARARLGRPQVHEVQSPPRRQLVAIRVGLVEVMDGIQEQHRDVRAGSRAACARAPRSRPGSSRSRTARRCASSSSAMSRWASLISGSPRARAGPRRSRRFPWPPSAPPARAVPRPPASSGSSSPRARRRQSSRRPP